MSVKVRWALLALVLLLAFLIALDARLIPEHVQICDEGQETTDQNCATYHVAVTILVYVARFLEHHEGAFVGLGTLIIAGFTGTLWWSTRRLWKASKDQSVDMKASIAEGARSATAMEGVAQGISDSVNIAAETQELLRTSTRAQIRAYLTVLIHEAVYQEREKNFYFGVAPRLLNTGFTPAHKVTYRARCGIFPHPLPDDVVLEPPEDTLRGAAVLGSQQSYVLNAALPDFINDAEVDEVRLGHKRRIHIWGTVQYEDVFGRPWETNFCQSMFWFQNENGVLMPAGSYVRRHNDAT